MQFGDSRSRFILFFAPLLLNVLTYVVLFFLWDADVANQTIVATLITSYALELVLFVYFTIRWRFFDIPEEIYLEQQKRINDFWPQELSLLIYPSSVDCEYEDADGVTRPCLSLDIKNNTKRYKILELEASIDHLYQTRIASSGKPHSLMFSIRDSAGWDDGSKKIELPPEDEKRLLIARFSHGDPNRVVFGKTPYVHWLFEEVGMYQVWVSLRGKIEGETEYRWNHHQLIFYADTKNNRLVFGEDAKHIPDLPPSFLQSIEASEVGAYYDHGTKD